MELPKNTELEKLERFMKALRISTDVLDDLGVFVKKSRYLFMCKKELHDLMLASSTNFFSIGFPLGELKKEFLPTPEFIDFLSTKSNRQVVVNKKSEWMFLCNNDIFRKGITEFNLDKKRGMVFIQNEQGENLGLAKFMTGGDVSLRNILDKGAYIRKEA